MGTMFLDKGERIFTEQRTATFRKENYEYVHIGIIDSNGDTWTTTELDEANVNQIWNQYRTRHGIPFPDEIVRLRKYYGLSAAKMSEILGFGINQYRYYESGEVPSESNARILIAIRDKKTFQEFLEASREKIGERDYAKIKTRLENLSNPVRPISTPSEKNGYKAYDAEKVSNIVAYFISKMGSTFVTKMNKLLFYADFLSYRRCGFGLTGLRYVAMQFGPVPENWGGVYDSLKGISMVECVLSNQSSGIKLEVQPCEFESSLSEFEIDVLNDVCNRFLDMSARDISYESHKERGWIENNQYRNIIDYTYAFDLSMI